MQPSPQITQLAPPSPHDHSQWFHVLPHLSVRDEPGVWVTVIEILTSRGLSREQALTRIRFAYTGSLTGDLPPGVR